MRSFCLAAGLLGTTPVAAETLTLHNRVGCTDTYEAREVADLWLVHRSVTRDFFINDPEGAQLHFPSCQLIEKIVVAPYAEQTILRAAWEITSDDGTIEIVIGETYLDLGRIQRQP